MRIGSVMYVNVSIFVTSFLDIYFFNLQQVPLLRYPSLGNRQWGFRPPLASSRSESIAADNEKNVLTVHTILKTSEL